MNLEYTATQRPQFSYLKDEIIKLLLDYQKTNTEHPSRVYLTKFDEECLYNATVSEIGDALMGMLIVMGPRLTFQKIFGMSTIWDSQERKVQ